MREIHSKDKTIGTYLYRVTPLGVGKGKALLVRLAKIIGPGIAEAISGIAASGGDISKTPISALAPSLTDICERLNEEDLDYAIKVLAEETEISEGGGFARLAPLVEYHFRAAYDELFKWLAFALEVNYGSFLAATKNLTASSPDLPTSPSKSQGT